MFDIAVFVFIAEVFAAFVAVFVTTAVFDLLAAVFVLTATFVAVPQAENAKAAAPNKIVALNFIFFCSDSLKVKIGELSAKKRCFRANN